MIGDDKLVLKNYIEDLRRFKLNSPVIYSGFFYDADQIARENIQGKIIEIQSKQALGITAAELFWKDTANVIHTWATLSDYLIFLQNLAILIAERGTLLYATAWSKKAEVEALTTVTEVVTYDVNSGW